MGQGAPSSQGLRAYRAAEQTRSVEEREAEILRHLRLVHAVVERLAVNLPAHVERDDLFHPAVIGLIDATDRFDPERDTAFSTYAVLRIRGAIIDELRSRDWVPRGARQRARRYQQTVADLHHRLERLPTDQELADALGVPIDELPEAERSSQLACQISLETSVGDCQSLIQVLPADSESDDPAATLEREDRRRILRKALDALREEERLIIKLYYFEGLLLREIATVLGKTESRICQIHGRVMSVLRHQLPSDGLEG